MADEAKPKIQDDAFGAPRDVESGKVVVPTPAEVGVKTPEEKAAETAKAAGKEGGKAAVEEIDKNPVVIELRKNITDLTTSLEKETGDKRSMGQNLSKMRDRLEKLEKGGTEITTELPYKKEDIKRVKDYTADEQKEMSTTERALIEQMADMMEKANKDAVEAAKTAAKSTEEAKETEHAAEWKGNFDVDVQAEAMKLAGQDVNLANQILTNFNLFAGNDKLADDEGHATKELLERLASAARMIPEYKAPKEQGSTGGGTGKAAGAGADAKPFEADNNKIVEEVQTARKPGAYSL